MAKADRIEILEHCKGCGICIHVCPQNVLAESENFNEYGNPYPYVRDLKACIVCRLCELNCPDFAIDVYAAGEGK